MTSVDFPHPVLPIIAVVSPGLAVKSMSVRTFSSAPGYAKAVSYTHLINVVTDVISCVILWFKLCPSVSTSVSYTHLSLSASTNQRKYA